MPKTLFGKIWDSHVVKTFPDGTALLYIDRQLVHEVTSAQAFEGLRLSGRKVRHPELTFATMDHNVPTVDRFNIKDLIAKASLEALEEMGSPWQKIYYLQEHINKPGRDIRAFVVGNEVIAAIYRHSTEKSGWITNTGRGGTASKCEVTPELSELCLKAVRIVSEGIYGVDLMETGNGLVVHEINHTAEFKSCAATTGVDVAGKIIEYAVFRAKR